MRLEYIDTGVQNQECRQLIRLYDFDHLDADFIHNQFTALAKGSVDTIALHELPQIVTTDGCELTLIVSDKDYGIWQLGPLRHFECKLTRDTWNEVAYYIEPFLTPGNVDKFQWLDQTFQWTKETSDICFLFSPNGQW